jgi:hypothetical protein
VHLGTGNYHPKTARLYSDFGLLTCNEEIGADTNEVFKQLTGLGRAQTLTHLWQAPFTLQPNVVAGDPGRSRSGARRQAFTDHRQDEFAARTGNHRGALRSVAGRRQDRPHRARRLRAARRRQGSVGQHQRRSIIGRQLEHHRVFYFYAGGEEKVYLSSADWMERNFFRRIELAFPVLDRKLKRRVIAEGLQIYLTDNTLAWELGTRWQLPPAARLAHQPAFVAGRADRTAEGLIALGGTPPLPPRHGGRLRRGARRPRPARRAAGRASVELRHAADLGGEAHVRVALPRLRVDRDDVDFLARENVRHVAQQTLPVVGVDHDVHGKDAVVCCRPRSFRSPARDASRACWTKLLQSARWTDTPCHA